MWGLGAIRYVDKIIGFHMLHDWHVTQFRDAGALTPRHHLILSYLYLSKGPT